MDGEELPKITYKDVIFKQEEEIGKLRERLHNIVSDLTAIKLDIVKINDKLDNPKPCSLHINSMKELSDGINRIELASATSSSKIDGFMSLAKDLILKHDTDIYKEEGLISTASSNKKQIALLWTIVTAIFIAGGVMFIWRR